MNTIFTNVANLNRVCLQLRGTGHGMTALIVHWRAHRIGRQSAHLRALSITHGWSNRTFSMTTWMTGQHRRTECFCVSAYGSSCSRFSWQQRRWWPLLWRWLPPGWSNFLALGHRGSVGAVYLIIVENLALSSLVLAEKNLQDLLSSV